MKRRLDNENKKAQLVAAIVFLPRFFTFFGVFPHRLGRGEVERSRIGLVTTCMWLVVLAGAVVFVVAQPNVEYVTTIERCQFVVLAYVHVLAFVACSRRFRRIVTSALALGVPSIDPAALRRKVMALAVFQTAFSLIALPIAYGVPSAIIASRSTWTDPRIGVLASFCVLANALFLTDCVFVDLVLFLRECLASVNRRLSSAVCASNDERDLTAHLRQLVETRQRIVDLVREANALYGPQLLVSSWLALFEMLFNSYYAVAFAFEAAETVITTTTRSAVEFLYSASVALNAVRFTFLCYACTAFLIEANETAVGVHRVLSLRPTGRLSVRLHEYSFGLHVCRPRTTAAGFFDVDLGLCRRTVSGLCAYLVILLQFRFAAR